MDPGEEPPEQALRALQALSSALQDLVEVVEDAGLEPLNTDQFVGFLQGFEQVRNRMAVVDHRAIRDAESRDLATSLCQGRLSRVLCQALRISVSEANRRIRGAEQLGHRVTPLGEPVPPVRAVLAEAQRAGSVTPEQVDLVLTGLAKVDRPGYDPADIEAGEEMLTGLARTFGPRDLRVCVERFVEHLDPDGTVPDDQLNADRRDVRLSVRRDGSWSGELRLTGALGAKLSALLTPLAKPRVTVVDGPNGRLVEAVDERTHGQRMHDALEDLCDRLLRGGVTPEGGGVPATVIVTVDAQHLVERTGQAVATDGTRLTVPQLLQLATEAEVIPAVLNQAGAVLTLGRSRRIASRAQTLALVARDGGCSFPGCDRPPEWCERHHLKAWIDGGPTDLDNLTLVCRYHHSQFAGRGWTCRLDPDRLPTWVPPRHIDPDQTPLLHHRIQAARTRYERVA